MVVRKAQANAVNAQLVGTRLCCAAKDDGRASVGIGERLDIVERNAAGATDAAQTDAEEFGDGFFGGPTRRQRFGASIAQRRLSRRKRCAE